MSVHKLPCFIRTTSFSSLQMTKFKHSRTHVPLSRSRQKNKEDFVQKLTEEWITEDDGQ